MPVSSPKNSHRTPPGPARSKACDPTGSASPAPLGELKLQMVTPAPQKSSQAPARHRALGPLVFVPAIASVSISGACARSEFREQKCTVCWCPRRICCFSRRNDRGGRNQSSRLYRLSSGSGRTLRSFCCLDRKGSSFPDAVVARETSQAMLRK
jgi:hypothetical protein